MWYWDISKGKSIEVWKNSFETRKIVLHGKNVACSTQVLNYAMVLKKIHQIISISLQIVFSFFPPLFVSLGLCLFHLGILLVQSSCCFLFFSGFYCFSFFALLDACRVSFEVFNLFCIFSFYILGPIIYFLQFLDVYFLIRYNLQFNLFVVFFYFFAIGKLVFAAFCQHLSVSFFLFLTIYFYD